MGSQAPENSTVLSAVSHLNLLGAYIPWEIHGDKLLEFKSHFLADCIGLREVTKSPHASISSSVKWQRGHCTHEFIQVKHTPFTASAKLTLALASPAEVQFLQQPHTVSVQSFFLNNNSVMRVAALSIQLSKSQTERSPLTPPSYPLKPSPSLVNLTTLLTSAKVTQLP